LNLGIIDARARLLRAALGFFALDPREPELQLLHRCAELDFALRQLRKSLERSGHHATLHRASMTHPRRARFKRRLAAKRHARAVARRWMMEVRREGL
jgi:ribosomal protein S21